MEALIAEHLSDSRQGLTMQFGVADLLVKFAAKSEIRAQFLILSS